MVIRNRYAILHQLGGNHSHTYLALDQVSMHMRAVKLLDLASYRKEYHILQQLKGPHFARLLDAFEEDGKGVLVLEYISGETLERMIMRRGPLPEETLLTVGIALTDTLSYLHGLSPPILHLDLKPSNVMLDEHSRVCLIDFGVSAEFWVDGVDGACCVGTPGYAAPEQYSGSDFRTGLQTDLYGLGKILERMMTGYRSASEHLRHDTYSAGLFSVVSRALRPDPKERYQSAQELKKALIDCRKKKLPASFGFACAAILVTAAVFLKAAGVFDANLSVLPGYARTDTIRTAGQFAGLLYAETAVKVAESAGKKVWYARLLEAGMDFDYPKENLSMLLWNAELEIDRLAKETGAAGVQHPLMLRMDCIKGYHALCNLYILREAELDESAGLRIESVCESALLLIQKSYADPEAAGESRIVLLEEEAYFLDCLIGRTEDDRVRVSLEQRYNVVKKEVDDEETTQQH